MPQIGGWVCQVDAEHDHQGPLQRQCPFLGKEQGPVIMGPLIPAHPVDDRPFAFSAVLQEAAALLVNDVSEYQGGFSQNNQSVQAICRRSGTWR